MYLSIFSLVSGALGHLRRANSIVKNTRRRTLGERLDEPTLGYDGRLSKLPLRHPCETGLIILNQRHMKSVSDEIRIQFANVKFPSDPLCLSRRENTSKIQIAHKEATRTLVSDIVLRFRIEKRYGNRPTDLDRSPSDTVNCCITLNFNAEVVRKW